MSRALKLGFNTIYWAGGPSAGITETIDVVAEEATGEERERLFTRAAGHYPQLAKAARKTDRVIPMIVLTPRGSA